MIAENTALRYEVDYLRAVVASNECEFEIAKIESDIERVESELAAKRNELAVANNRLYLKRREMREFEVKLDDLQDKADKAAGTKEAFETHMAKKHRRGPNSYTSASN